LKLTFSCWTSTSLAEAFIHCLSSFLRRENSAECFLVGDCGLESSSLPSHNPQLSLMFTQFKASLPLSRAPGTWALNKPMWDKFCDWCRAKGVKFLPVSPLLAALHMTDLLRTAHSPSPVLSFSRAVYFFHTLAGLPSPTSHPLMGLAREIARWTKVAGKNQKRPFLASQIRRIISAWAGPSAPLHQFIKAVATTVCFWADNLLTLQLEDIRFVGQSHMEIFLERSKTEQYREGRMDFSSSSWGSVLS
jgi:hypothetical protein